MEERIKEILNELPSLVPDEGGIIGFVNTGQQTYAVLKGSAQSILVSLAGAMKDSENIREIITEAASLYARYSNGEGFGEEK